ncbi:MAG: helix-turn-helix transcriptional regulator [Oscillospiraceae bacterium]|nr:helix-turn-helix transcriptional regulator [Oscillospiraceae bacterium]
MSYSDKEIQAFAHNLYLLRKVRRLSRKQLAAIAGTSAYSIHKAESGVFPNTFSATVIAKISRFFHLSPAAMFSPICSVSLLTKGEQDV